MDLILLPPSLNPPTRSAGGGFRLHRSRPAADSASPQQGREIRGRNLIVLIVIASTTLAPVLAPAQELIEQTEVVSTERDLQLPPNTNEDEAGEVGDWTDPAEFTRAHWVRLTPTGELKGQVLTIDAETGRPSGTQALSVEVYQKGARLGQAQTDESGAFTIAGLQPGVYALIARGPDGFLAYGLQLLPSLAQSKLDQATTLIQAPVAKPTLEIRSAAVPPTFRQIKTILEDNYSSMRKFYVPEAAYQPFLEEAVAEQQPGHDEDAGPEAYRGFKQLAEDDTPAAKTLAASTISLRPVMLTDDNTMFGKLYGIDATTGRPRRVNNTTVYIIRNDLVVTNTQVDERGFFKIKLPRPNVYSMVVAGEGGFGAASFRAIKRIEAAPGDREVRRRRPFDELVRLTRYQLDDLLNDAPLDDPIPGPSAPSGMVPDLNGQGNVMAAPFALGVIDDPDTIRAACDHWTAPGAGGMFDAGLAGAAPLPPPPPPVGGFGGATAGGGFAGGAGAGFGLVGLAGLAGLAGLGGNNRDRVEFRQVSPFEP